MAAICLIAVHRLIDLRGCYASVTVVGGREAGHCQAEAGELSHLAGTPAPRNSRRGSPGARPRPSAGLRRTENVGSQLLSLLQCPARGIVSAISGVVKKPKRRLRPATRIEPGRTPRAGTQGRRACHPMRLFTAPGIWCRPVWRTPDQDRRRTPLRRVEVDFNRGAARNALINMYTGRTALCRAVEHLPPSETNQVNRAHSGGSAKRVRV